jgi:aspartokinase-like uncharacterized kinase
MRVVKLGGSLYNKVELTSWLDTLLSQGTEEIIVIVPGGGPFADQVRRTQTEQGFSDVAAHHMAILAMAQFGVMLSDYHSDIQTTTLAEQPTKPSLYVWLPDASIIERSALSQNWAVTSDSLALWFAQSCHASELHIVKCCDTLPMRVDSLCSEGVLDEAFASLYAQCPLPTKLFHYQAAADYPASGKSMS